MAVNVEEAAAGNRIVSVAYDQGGVLITTQKPVGDRYAVYDSVDPLRIVADFSDTDVSGLAPEIAIADANVKQVRLSSF
jgi:type IV pilus assembly protein PilQ